MIYPLWLRRKGSLFLFPLFAAAVTFKLASAVERVYDIVTSQSSIAISGTVTSATLGTAPIEQQAPGSLLTNYMGTIRTDRGPNTIQFLAGSTVDANVNGNWQPLADGSAGTAPADYGGRAQFNVFATLYFAARDAVGDLASGLLAMSGGDFDLSTTTFSFLQGSVAYRDSPFGTTFGARSLVGESSTLSGTASLTTEMQVGGSLETLSIPISSSVAIAAGDGFVNLTLTGQLVATALAPATLLGDYNQDGSVDAADYVVWRKTDGLQEGYEMWRDNFGSTAGSGAAAEASETAVPEPSTFAQLCLLAAGSTILSLRRAAANG
jgi:hypothetical protein